LSKTLIIALVGVLGGGAVAAGVFFFFFKPFGESVPPPEPTPVSVAGKIGPHIILPARVFNLRTEPGKPAVYLKLETLIEFQTTDEAWARVLRGCVKKADGSPCKAEEEALLHEFDEEIGTGRKLIEDAVTTIVSAKTLTEVSSPEGKERMRTEIQHAVEELIPHPEVVRVLFTDFVTQ
jgi:flagellar basal body-associated protein FliL